MGSIPSSVKVHISKQKGWYIGTSTDLHGLFVSHPKFTVFASEVPEVIKALFKEQYAMDVEVRETTSPEGDDLEEVVFVAEKRAA